MPLGYFVLGYYYITTCHSKQLPVGLIVPSDGMAHFLEDREQFKQIYQTLLWL